MPADGCFGLRQCFAGLYALVPRVIMHRVSGTSTVSEPRTTATAATDFPRFGDDATFGAYRMHGRRRDYWCVCMWTLVKTRRSKHESSHCLACKLTYVLAVNLGLTFAGLDALKPPVSSASSAGTSTILIPSTARSATTDSA